MKEIWKPIKGFEGHYEISNRGRVKALRRKIKVGNQWNTFPQIIMSCPLDSDGYRIVGLHLDGKAENKRVGRLVALHFISNPKKLPIVHHKDHDKTNDYMNNLQWVTNSENIQFAYDSGFANAVKGSRCGSSKLTEKDVRRIRRLAKAGAIHQDLRKEYGISTKNIHLIINRKTWKHVL